MITAGTTRIGRNWSMSSTIETTTEIVRIHVINRSGKDTTNAASRLVKPVQRLVGGASVSVVAIAVVAIWSALSRHRYGAQGALPACEQPLKRPRAAAQ